MIASAAASAALGKHLPDEGKKPKKAKKDKRFLHVEVVFRHMPGVSLSLFICLFVIVASHKVSIDAGKKRDNQDPPRHDHLACLLQVQLRTLLPWTLRHE